MTTRTAASVPLNASVAGTATGITALQMDIKVSGITMDIMRTAREQARRGRMHMVEVGRRTERGDAPG